MKILSMRKASGPFHPFTLSPFHPFTFIKRVENALVCEQHEKTGACVLYIQLDHAVVSAAHEGLDHLDFYVPPEKLAPRCTVASLRAAAEHRTLYVIR